MSRNSKTSRRTGLSLGALLLLLAGCTVGPDYSKPEAPVTASYKELKDWKVATPREAGANQAWWSVYDDAVLDGLEKQVAVSNQNLKAAEAAYRQAAAVIEQARASYFPTLAATGTGQRSGPLAHSKTGGTANAFGATATGSWDLDLWGKISRTVEGDIATAQASAADIAAARLSAQSQLATAYFQLRAVDEQKRLLEAAVKAYTEALKITQNQFAVGVAAQSDVLSAKTQLEQTQSQAVNTGVQRAQLEHAIAVLIGKPPADLSIVVQPTLTDKVPVIPAGVPSALLERRPDIAAAERQMAAANAQIGVAVAAYYPDVSLSASLGVASAMIGNLFTASSALWSIGGQVAETIFDAGARAAVVEEARATYDQNVANYRQTVLTAFQGVEDQLASLRILEQQAAIEDQTVKDAREAERLMLNRYLAGNVPYTSVITAQQTALTNEESALTILENRLTASVALIQDLGGGWNAAELPNP